MTDYPFLKLAGELPVDITDTSKIDGTLEKLRARLPELEARLHPEHYAGVYWACNLDGRGVYGVVEEARRVSRELSRPMIARNGNVSTYNHDSERGRAALEAADILEFGIARRFYTHPEYSSALDRLLYNLMVNVNHYANNRITGISGNLELREAEGRDDEETNRLMRSFHLISKSFSRKANRMRKLINTNGPADNYLPRSDQIEPILQELYCEVMSKNGLSRRSSILCQRLEQVYQLMSGEERGECLRTSVNQARILLHELRYLESLGDFEFSDMYAGSTTPLIDIPPISESELLQV